MCRAKNPKDKFIRNANWSDHFIALASTYFFIGPFIMHTFINLQIYE